VFIIYFQVKDKKEPGSRMIRIKFKGMFHNQSHET